MADSGRLRVIAELHAAFSDTDPVEFAVLFGPFVEKQETPSSDIDVAIKSVRRCHPRSGFAVSVRSPGTVERSALR